ncbi:MAG: UDP-3-O-(3-hydroxymyristoyl)glucosamine N-acyltransferase [Cyanobacteriota bacterium]|nr:UDP-3-O-(3-hydroxymyristoyl)glucosamine N-acyltransferase [Cyanobacteriota bacterium]
MQLSQLIKGLSEVTAQTPIDLAGDPQIDGADSLERAQRGQLCFLEKGHGLASLLPSSRASAILIPGRGDEALKLRQLASERGMAWVGLENPKLGFAEALELLYPRRTPAAGIHPSARVGSDSLVGEGTHLGANVSVGSHCVIGARCVLHPGVVLMDDVRIDEDCEVHANAVIHPGSRIGRRCVIHSAAVIGSEGFGFIPTENGWRRMPQIGVVILEEGVEVGCGSTVDRPCVGETRIGMGSKLDNLVHIGHGVQIGRHCAIAAQVGIAGGSQIGDHVILAGQVGVATRAVIEDRVTATSKSGLHGRVAAGQVVSGYPAIAHARWMRCVAAFSRLPDLLRAGRR